MDTADDDGGEWTVVGPDPQENMEEEQEEQVDLEAVLTQASTSFRLKFNTDSPRVQKVLFAKLERTVSPDIPGGKSLALSGIPPWATTASIKAVLDDKCQGNGAVKAVYFVKSLKDNSNFTPGKLTLQFLCKKFL